MIQLSTFLWVMILMFAGIGFMRGWAKELVATAGIVLALFTLKQFESIVIDPLTNGEQASKFYLQATILLIIGFSPTGRRRSVPRPVAPLVNREGLQKASSGRWWAA